MQRPDWSGMDRNRIIEDAFPRAKWQGISSKLIRFRQVWHKTEPFFETLKSERRLKLCSDVSLSLYETMRSKNLQTDPFASFAFLDGYDIHAGDGHYHGAAVHDVRKDGKKHPTQHFYSVDLRSHALRHLSLADTSGTRKREHDTRALKRQHCNTSAVSPERPESDICLG